MMFNEAHDSSPNDLALEQDAVWLDRLLPELEWDESEESFIVAEVIGNLRCTAE